MREPIKPTAFSCSDMAFHIDDAFFEYSATLAELSADLLSSMNLDRNRLHDPAGLFGGLSASLIFIAEIGGE